MFSLSSLMLSEGHHALSDHSPKVVLFCLYLLFSLRKQRLLQGKMNKDSRDSSLKWFLFSLICLVLMSCPGISSGRMISSNVSVPLSKFGECDTSEVGKR